MNAYISQIIYRITCIDVQCEQYEEQLRLVFAEDERQALEETKRIASLEECSFVDRRGRRVTWQMIAVKDLHEVDLTNGSLLFSTVKEVEPIATPVWQQ